MGWYVHVKIADLRRSRVHGTASAPLTRSAMRDPHNCSDRENRHFGLGARPTVCSGRRRSRGTVGRPRPLAADAREDGVGRGAVAGIDALGGERVGVDRRTRPCGGRSSPSTPASASAYSGAVSLGRRRRPASDPSRSRSSKRRAAHERDAQRPAAQHERPGRRSAARPLPPRRPASNATASGWWTSPSPQRLRSAGVARERHPRRRVEGLPSDAGEVDLGPHVRVLRAHDPLAREAAAVAGNEAGRDTRRDPERTQHHDQAARDLLAPTRLRTLNRKSSTTSTPCRRRAARRGSTWCACPSTLRARAPCRRSSACRP